MKLTLTSEALYVDNVFLCLAARGDHIRPGVYEVEVRYSHHHQQDLVHADGLGLLGGTEGVNVVLGRVRSSTDVIPCLIAQARVIAMVERAQERGERISLTVE